MFIWNGTDDSLVIPGLLNRFRCDSGLVRKLLPHVFKLFASVVFFTDLFEIVLYHVKVIFILFMCYSWVSDDADTKFMERLDDFLALLFPALLAIKIGLEVYDWRLTHLYLLLSHFNLLILSLFN